MGHPEHSVTNCVVCGAGNLEIVIEIPSVPTHCNVLWNTHAEAINASRGDIRLVFCSTCGHVFNAVFQPELMSYTQTYENSLHFSPRFQRYAEALASRLVEKYNLRKKDIIEIGCGQGDFLTLLCQLGQNRGVGFDPSYISKVKVNALDDHITFIQDFYSMEDAALPANLITCRHVLEHIQYPVEFLTTIRQIIGHRLDIVTFFEVPNALFTLRDLAIWDIIYEHCSYFSLNSLEQLFTRCGFKVIDVAETFAGQYLYLEGMPSDSNKQIQEPQVSSSPRGSILTLSQDSTQTMRQDNSVGMISTYIKAFADSYNCRMQTWQAILSEMAQAGQSGVIWGAGSKGVTFLNILDTQGCIEYAIDINPRKVGKFVPGSGQQIKPPEFLMEYRPDVVIIMNPLYADEIRHSMQQLQVSAQILVAI